MSDKDYCVRAAHCDHRADEGEVFQTLRRITDPLSRSWDALSKADRIVVKFNMMKRPDQIYYYGGRRRELVDEAVCRGVLELLRERTDADLIVTDTNPYDPKPHLMRQNFNFAHILKEYGASFVDSNAPPFRTYDVPGGGLMFDRYTLSACLEGAEVVSVAKMKNHGFMGVTLCTKNLFGLPPMLRPHGRTRSYYHHFIRLPYVLADLGRITSPCLNIVDALTGQWGREWGGEGRISNALIAGDQATATDACGAHSMGHDPSSDWPAPPFRRDRNHLLVAAERGSGTVDLDAIDFESEVVAPLADFDSVETDASERVGSWRRTTCEQALIYRDDLSRFVDRYAGEFIYLQDGEVVWNGPDPSNLGSRRQLSGDRKDEAMWLKWVDPEDEEGERFEVYEGCLEAMAA